MSVVTLLVVLLASRTAAQEVEMDGEHLIEVASQVMRAAGECALITLDAEGGRRPGPWTRFPPEPDLRVWMGTSHTRKVTRLRAEIVRQEHECRRRSHGLGAGDPRATPRGFAVLIVPHPRSRADASQDT